MNANVQLERLTRIYREHGSLTVACDLDNTLFDFHYEKEKTTRSAHDLSEVAVLLRRLKALGCFIIIWTANEDTAFISQFLSHAQIPYDTINEDPPYFKGKSRKIYYNALLDDAAGLRETYLLLCRFINVISPNSI